PIMSAVGAAVDYSRANNYRSKLLAAADAAAVGSVATTSPAMIAASNMQSDGAVSAGVTDAVNIFNGQIAGKGGLWTNLSISATVARANGAVTSSVQFTANAPTM